MKPTEAPISRHPDGPGPWMYHRATDSWTHGLPAWTPKSASARRPAPTAAELEVARLQAAIGKPRPGEDLVRMLARQHRERQAAAAAGSPSVVTPPPEPTPEPAPSDAAGVRARRAAENAWGREQALITAAKMREQRGGWGR